MYTMESKGAVSSYPDRSLIDEPRIINEINTEKIALRSVACLNDEEIWTCSGSSMRLYNLQDQLVKVVQTKSGGEPIDILVTRIGDLLYTDYDDKTVNIVKNTQIQTVIRLRGWKPFGVCSTSSGDFLILMNSNGKQSKVSRYAGSVEKQNIQYGDNKKPLFSPHGCNKYINENRNLDICVSDFDARAVVVVNQAGRLRFTYTGHPSATKEIFYPRGITTDSDGRILIADCNNHRIHILDQNGHFIRYIDNCPLNHPQGLCLDSRDNLVLTEWTTGKLKKIKYLI
nr:protein lin-41-like [Crassostrea gigas]|eukprot:XP_011431978.1 PREDICTED: protein lin-41 [Crassostrea gigas]